MPPRHAVPIRATKVPEIRTGDTVIVLVGKDAGKRGLVERVVRNPQGFKKTQAKYGARLAHTSPLATASVVVEGLNVAKRHTKPRQSASSTDRMPKVQQGGILDLAQPLPIGKVMLVCTHCDRPTRIAHKVLDNGRRVRVCRHCGEQLEVKS
ncbi:MAG TPA: 50S ribosomal protein L24 [Candidatus Limnocylindrales bacterium]|jgi:large subunit ribosomal protein L24|nr:50S ribosomal protein L24 [Candidatus Limnocylindrales bacterium]